MKKMYIAIIIVLAVILLAGCGIDIGNRYDNAEKYTAGDAVIDGKVKTLMVYWDSGSVDIVTGSESTVSVSETANREISDEMRLRWWLDGTTLRIRFMESGKTKPVTDFSKALTVVLPADIALDSVKVDAASADVRVNGISTDTVRVSIASGDTELSLTANEIEVKSASGDVRVNSGADIKKLSLSSASGKQYASFPYAAEAEFSAASGSINVTANGIGKFTASASSGDVVCDFASAPAKAGVKTASGDVYVNMPAGAGFTLDVDTAGGKFVSDLPMKLNGKKYVCGDGSAAFSVSTASGNVNFRER